MKISRDTSVGIACGILLTLGFHSFIYFTSAVMKHHWYQGLTLDGFNSLVILVVVLALSKNKSAIRLLKWSLIYFAFILNCALFDQLLRAFVPSTRLFEVVHFSELKIDLWFAWSLLCLLSAYFLHTSEPRTKEMDSENSQK